MTIATQPLAGASLADRYLAVRRTTDALRAPLTPEDCVVQSMTDASPVKWHLGHTTWFFEQFVLRRFTRQAESFDACFPYIFNSYYTRVGDRQPRAERGMITRPSLDRVLEYRRVVDERMLELLSRDALPEEAARITRIGLNHEQQHQELLLTDVRHALWCGPLQAPYDADPCPPTTLAAPLEWDEFEAGLLWVGYDGTGFCYDNEQPAHKVFLRPFALASRHVTCGEYLAFMADGGYAREDLWLDEGAAAVRAHGWEAPMYWRRDGDQWLVSTLHGERPVDADEPVTNVGFFEAEAFARWAGARLPTESEWEAACLRAAERTSADWRHMVAQGQMLESGWLHPRAATPADAALHGLFGTVWEWTRSGYDPYPGYAPEAGALGEYNGKFMSSQYVLRGGSCATPASHIRPTYRNFFHPTKRWQFSGIRLAKDTH
ncbi:MAG: ergothioneine biosynthesis protein EgtB [Planctomycetota bacterium]